MRLLAVTPVTIGASSASSDALRGKALDDVLPDHVFIECYRAKYDNVPSDDLLNAFHELIAIAHAGAP